MIVSGLSEKEVVSISKILEDEKVPFEISFDKAVEYSNSESMKNDLRHKQAPSISEQLLCVSFPDAAFASFSSHGKAKLLEFGVTDQVPSEADFSSPNDYLPHCHKPKKPMSIPEKIVMGIAVVLVGLMAVLLAKELL